VSSLPLRRVALRAIAVLSLVAASPLLAHDFWLEPSSYRPDSGQRVTVRARVGMSFVGDPVPRDEDLLVRFVAVTSEGELPVPGVHGRDPAGIAWARGTGSVQIAYESRPSLAELTPDKLQIYVEQEGLASQLSASAQHALAGRVVHDRFARSVKTMLVIKGGAGQGFDRILGLPLELVPLVDPTTLATGGALPVRLLYQGKPLAGVQVSALSRLDPLHPVLARSDASGLATLVLPRGGEWLLKAVRVTPAPAASGADLDSLWTSLTFRTDDGP